jgi:hypothetical protein
MPAAIANREAILAAPENVEKIINDYRAKVGNQKRSQAEQEQLNKAKARMPAHQEEIIAYGKRFWPLLEERPFSYDYDQLRCACWFFRCLEAVLSTTKENTPHGRALSIRNLIKFPSEYTLHIHRDHGLNNIFETLRSITFELEKNPEGECKWPGFPHVEGKW